MTAARRGRWNGVLAAALVAVQVSACNSASRSNTSPPADAGAICAATPEETIGAACSVEGSHCGPQYTCGVLDVTLLCVCHQGTFRCTDLAGNELTAAPNCPSPQSDGGACPTSESRAIQAACSEQGLLCTYPSHCPSRFDQCECFPGPLADGGFGLRFDCRLTSCGAADGGIVVFDSGSAVDSGHAAPDASRDAGLEGSSGSVDSSVDADADSAIDGPSPTDATPPDAPPG